MKRLMRKIFGEDPQTRLETRHGLELPSLYAEYSRRHKIEYRQWMELWVEIASIIGVPPGKLRCADRFDQELVHTDGLLGVNTSCESLEEWAEYQINQQGGRQREGFGDIHCVEDLIAFIHENGTIGKE